MTFATKFAFVHVCQATEHVSASRASHNGDDLLLILAIFGDHTIESKTAVIEHVRVTERDKGALCDFWNKSNVAPNRECKKET